MTLVIPDVFQWMRRCADANHVHLLQFIFLLRREYIQPQLSAYRHAHQNILNAQVRHVGRKAISDRSRPAKANPLVAKYKQDRAARRAAQHALQVLVRAEELARMRLQYVRNEALRRARSMPAQCPDEHALALPAHLLSYAMQMPAAMLMKQSNGAVDARKLRFEAQNFTRDKAEVALAVLGQFPELFGVLDIAEAPEQAEAVARERLYRKLRASCVLDASEQALLKKAFGQP